MPNLSIKDVPESLAEQLRQRAARNHRSLQGELMAIVEAAVVDPPYPDASGPNMMPSAAHRRSGTIVGYGAGDHPIIRRGWKTVEQIAAELKAEFPEPILDLPLGVDIIRADRDSR